LNSNLRLKGKEGGREGGREEGRKEGRSARCRWLTLVLLATQKAEIKRVVVQDQPGQIAHWTLSQK
jgi:hypothetical protein